MGNCDKCGKPLPKKAPIVVQVPPYYEKLLLGTPDKWYHARCAKKLGIAVGK